MKYFLSDIDMGNEEAQAVADVVRSKWLSLGPKTEQFETEFSNYFGTNYAIAVSNCTAALHLALMACGIKPGDEVLVPSYTFVASANAILYQGAKPVFVDINGPNDLNLNIDDLESKITSRTVAIIPVHIAGFTVDMDKLMKVAERHNLAVVEDASHAIGAHYQLNPESQYFNSRIGTIGTVGCFSFFANKNLPTGEGGMIVTNDDNIAKKVRSGRSHGMTKTSWDKASGRAVDYDIYNLGYNYRATEFMAALGSIQLSKLTNTNKRRKELVNHYRKHLSSTPNIILPFENRTDDSANHIFPIVLHEPAARTRFRSYLLNKGIQTSIHYPPVHLFSQYQSLTNEPICLEQTKNVSEREVTLPLHPLLRECDVDAICSEVNDAALTVLS